MRKDPLVPTCACSLMRKHSHSFVMEINNCDLFLLPLRTNTRDKSRRVLIIGILTVEVQYNGVPGKRTTTQTNDWLLVKKIFTLHLHCTLLCILREKEETK